MSPQGGSGRTPAAGPTAPPGGPRARDASSLNALIEGWLATPIGRRALLTRGAALAATAAAGSALACLRRPSPRQIAQATTGLGQAPWPTLAATHDHLFPNDSDGPSARDIHATAYLRALIDDPDFDPDDATFIRKGSGWLDDLAVKRGGAPFVRLDTATRERVVTEVAASGPGERWLSTLLLYLFEALLSDPIYGGNPSGIGWAWLDHQPGFPRPRRGQIYQVLRKA